MSLEIPEPVKAAVIVGHLAGKSNSQLSRELPVSRPTVIKILEESEIDRIISETKSILYEALPDSARTIAKAVKKKSSDAWELIGRAGVMPKESGDSNTNIAVGINLEGMPTFAQNQRDITVQADKSERPPEDSIY